MVLAFESTHRFFQASYFSRDDQALHGFSKYFEKASGEEREHGMKLMEYQVKRGGKVVFQDIAKPTTMEWGTALEAMEAALELEKTVIQETLRPFVDISFKG